MIPFFVHFGNDVLDAPLGHCSINSPQRKKIFRGISSYANNFFISEKKLSTSDSSKSAM